MGGWGSGRRSSKRTTDDMLRLDVRWLQRDGLLMPGLIKTLTWSRDGQKTGSIQISADGRIVRLVYQAQRTGGEAQQMDYPVRLAWTKCTLGGERAWFCCPAQGCGRRVAILYGGSVFACRHCHRLVYESQRERFPDRHALQVERVRKKLGWTQGAFISNYEKPKGMHWQTYNRLKTEHHRHSFASLMAMEAIHEVFEQKLAAIEGIPKHSG